MTMLAKARAHNAAEAKLARIPLIVTVATSCLES